MLDQMIEHHALSIAERSQLDNVRVALRPNRIDKPSHEFTVVCHLSGHHAAQSLTNTLQQPRERAGVVVGDERILPGNPSDVGDHCFRQERFIARRKPVNRGLSETSRETVQ
jgi:hypothetical protein